MSSGAWAMVLIVVMTAAALGFVVFSMVRSIRDEHRASGRISRDFSLSIILFALFLGTWIAHGFAQWQTFTDEQRAQGQSPGAGDFVGQFMQATLENWQSEFLQLFAFVSLAALYVHRGSAESKDGDERVEAALRRIEERLGTLPPDAPAGEDAWKLPDAPPQR